MARIQKLNQVIATVSGKKTAAEKALTEAYHVCQKGELFSGLHRTYSPRREGGDEKPPERKNPQYKVKDLYRKVEAELAEMLDGAATQDYANCVARADVIVDGRVLVAAAPVTYLLFLEKRVNELKNFAEKLPIRDAADDWTYQPESDLFVTPPARKQVTAKIQEAIVLYQATEQHPAQTQLISKDEVVGHWDERRFSGAITKQEQDILLGRLRRLTEAVKVAREEANQSEAPAVKVSGPVLDYVFGGVLK